MKKGLRNAEGARGSFEQLHRALRLSQLGWQTSGLQDLPAKSGGKLEVCSSCRENRNYLSSSSINGSFLTLRTEHRASL